MDSVPKINLFCIPYAGGSAVIYSKWKKYFDPIIELIPVELAGRGRRLQDPLYKNRQHAIEDIFNIIKADIQQRPYALFGHSLGALIGYELALKIRSAGLPQPVHLFLSGKGAPHIQRNDEKKFHLMNDETFKKELIELGGTPPEFFQHPDLLGMFLPLLKNDFKLAETEAQHNAIDPFDVDMTVFLGKDEDLTAAQCDGWKKYTKQICSIHYCEGGHFFLHDKVEQVTRLINQNLKEFYFQHPSLFGVNHGIYQSY
jgi:medium-chain acyl-[acyl-carrier-protein] hydrolase